MIIIGKKQYQIIVVITTVIITIAILIPTTGMFFFCSLSRGSYVCMIYHIWSSSEEKNNITSSLSSLLPSSSSSSSSSPQECSSPAVFLEACSYDRSLCGLLSNAEKLFKWALQNTAMVQKYFWNIAAQSCAGVFLFKTEIFCKFQRHFWNMQCRVVLLFNISWSWTGVAKFFDCTKDV